jgi:hypothetical protein
MPLGLASGWPAVLSASGVRQVTRQTTLTATLSAFLQFPDITAWRHSEVAIHDCQKAVNHGTMDLGPIHHQREEARM